MEPDVIPLSEQSAENKVMPLESNTNDEEDFDLGANVVQLRVTDGIRELQTVIRDKSTPRNDFIFYADRLIRLVVEEGLNKLPYRECSVTTPTGHTYDGLRYEKGNCGVSIVRSGEAMEQGLRDCCRSIRIGKILIQSDEDTHDAKVVYANLPKDIHQRKVLLMYPIMCTGNTVVKAVRILAMHNVKQENIILLNLFCTPHGAKKIIAEFPGLRILTSEIHPISPSHFGQKYFGTD
ncbi:uracil phosphoribosyltransferase homolog [Aplysia californica]|uniref:Uracil phosphoribosyltransferase homolog n=1 Tax=Aplysia californica TaxID=6500 RepID=A0ABM0K680_APLCA|nr:uracil phosphoribosyltransferase homolog [Aplysia californica]